MVIPEEVRVGSVFYKVELLIDQYHLMVESVWEYVIKISILYN